MYAMVVLVETREIYKEESSNFSLIIYLIKLVYWVIIKLCRSILNIIIF